MDSDDGNADTNAPIEYLMWAYSLPKGAADMSFCAFLCGIGKDKGIKR